MFMTEEKLRSIKLDAAVKSITDFKSIVESLIDHIYFTKGEYSISQLTEEDLHKLEFINLSEEALLNVLHLQNPLSEKK